jgi:hypothetical protein
VESVSDISSDFEPLIELLQNLQAANYRTRSEQLAHIERHLTAVEINPTPFDYVALKHAAGTASAISEMFDSHRWLPGRADLLPLFDLEAQNL